MKRRQFISSSLKAGASVLCFPGINTNRFRIFPGTEKEYSAKSIQLVQEATVVDMLNQFNGDFQILRGWLDDSTKFTSSDAEFYFDTGVNVFALGHTQRSKKNALEYIEKWNKFIAGHPKWLQGIRKIHDLKNLSRDRHIGILLTFQDSNHFESVDDIDLFYAKGQRLSQLTYNYKNQIGSGGFDDVDNGLSEFGEEAVQRMEKVGMAVDVSHCSDKTTLDALDIAGKPVILTHANCRALNPGHPRTKTDEMIIKTAAKGGLIGVPTIRFMVRDKEPVLIEHFLDHYDHIIKLVGVEFAGIGTDFDPLTEDHSVSLEDREKMYSDTEGERFKKYRMHTNNKFLVGVEGINHPKRIFDIVEGFIQRGYSDADIKLILGGNFIRVMENIWSE